MLDLAYLFSPSSGCPSRKLPFKRIAITGPAPASAPLQLALSFLTTGRTEDERWQDVESDPQVLILSSSRADWHAGLVEENDEHLAAHGGDPAITRQLQKNVDMRFLESTAQWRFFCSAVGEPTAESPKAGQTNPLTLSKRAPDLVIVHNLSGLLNEDKNAGAGVEVYSSLLAATLSAFADSQHIVFLDNIDARHQAIPLLPAHLDSSLRKRLRQSEAEQEGRGIFGARKPVSTTNNPGNQNSTSAYTPEPRKMPTRLILEYFCDGIGNVSDEGGMDNLNWYEIRMEQSGRTHRSAERINPFEPVNMRYAVHKVADESGYSGRDRSRVSFG